MSRDGSTLLVSDYVGGSHAIHEFRVADGSRLRVVGGKGSGRLRFEGPRQVWVASDDFVFVADYNNNRVQVLTPHLDFHAFIGMGQLHLPGGVCANDDVVIVSEAGSDRISVFNRGDGALVRHVGSSGSGNGQFHDLYGLCFLFRERHFAVADHGNNRVSVFSVAGDFIRHVGVGQLKRPHGVASSAFDELVVADTSNLRVVLFSASGELLKTIIIPTVTGVAIRGGAVFAQEYERCVIFGSSPQTSRAVAGAGEATSAVVSVHSVLDGFSWFPL